MNVLSQPTRPALRARTKNHGPRITIGLINNMADPALKVTERQFRGLVAEAAFDFDIAFRVFALATTRRSARALDYIEANYEPARAVKSGGLHALIITGAQPQADRLCNEPYWEELVELIDWAKSHTASTILSCLAAHAGVLHLDAIERRPLPQKCTGVFPFAAAANHALVGGRSRVRLSPHSRYNGLLESDLKQAGYAVLTNSPTHGVDIFTKDFGSQFVFMQGHPEYDANSLAREYRRDMDLYLRGETERKPARPQGYFEAEAEAELLHMERRAFAARSGAPLAELAMIDSLAPADAAWRDAAVSFYRNWIEMIADAVGRAYAASAEMEAPEFASEPYVW